MHFVVDRVDSYLIYINYNNNGYLKMMILLLFVAVYDVYDGYGFNAWVEMVDVLCFSCHYFGDCVLRAFLTHPPSPLYLCVDQFL